MSTHTINSTLEELLGQIDTLITDVSAPCPKNMNDGLQVYLALDPVLSDLYKQYLNSRKNAASLEKDKGRHDPMAEVARDMANSAFSAFQARLHELRDSETFTSMAAMRRMRDMRELERQQARAKELAKSEEAHRLRQQAKEMARSEEGRGVDEVLVLLLFFYLQKQMFASKPLPEPVALRSNFWAANRARQSG